MSTPPAPPGAAGRISQTGATPSAGRSTPTAHTADDVSPAPPRPRRRTRNALVAAYLSLSVPAYIVGAFLLFFVSPILLLASKEASGSCGPGTPLTEVSGGGPDDATDLTTEQIAAKILAEGTALGVSERLILSAFSVAMVESGGGVEMRNLPAERSDNGANPNLPGRTATSVGVFQQQDLPEWTNGGINRMNVREAARSYFRTARRLESRFPDPGALAAAVQRPAAAYRGRYAAAMPRARLLLKATKRAARTDGTPAPTPQRPADTPADSSLPKPRIVRDFIPFDQARRNDMRAYANRHYGINSSRLDPKVIVAHYTAGGTYQSARDTFLPNRPDRELKEKPGVVAHFVIDRDGTIYQLIPLDLMGRHTVGLNHVSIGVEMVGRNTQEIIEREDQWEAVIELFAWLQGRFSISPENVIGHNQNTSSPLHKENNPRLATQTHSDWTAQEMRTLHRDLNRYIDDHGGLRLGDRPATSSDEPSGCGPEDDAPDDGADPGGPLQIVEGTRARILDNGDVAAPADAPDYVKAMIREGNRINRYRYCWGGGHGKAGVATNGISAGARPQSNCAAGIVQGPGFDCSGATGAVLAAAGLGGPAHSSAFGRAPYRPGQGKWVTLVSSPAHVYIIVAGVALNTGSSTGRAGKPGSGPRWGSNPSGGMNGMTITHPKAPGNEP